MLNQAQIETLSECVTSLLQVVEPSTTSNFDMRCNDIVAVVLHTLAKAKNKYNELAYTARSLPTELLVKIFSMLGYRDLMCVTTVSSLWRDVAISFPMLWATIEADSNFNRSIFDMFISLAQHQPLDVRFDRDDDAFLAAILDSGCPLKRLATEYYFELKPERIQTHVRTAEILQYLSIGDISIVDAKLQPFLNLKTLVLHGQCGNISNLFQFCPNIVTMELHRVENGILKLPRPPFPSSLKNVYFHASHDFSEYLQLLHEIPLHTLRFNVAQFIWIKRNDLLELFDVDEADFIDTDRIPMFLPPHHRISVVSDFLFDKRGRMTDMITVLRNTSGSLRRLTLPDEKWHKVMGLNLEFPVLERLTLLSGFSSSSVHEDATLFAPRLRTLALRITGRLLSKRLIAFQDTWRRIIRPVNLRVKELVLDTTDKLFSLNSTIPPDLDLSSMAERVVVLKLVDGCESLLELVSHGP